MSIVIQSSCILSNPGCTEATPTDGSEHSPIVDHRRPKQFIVLRLTAFEREEKYYEWAEEGEQGFEEGAKQCSRIGRSRRRRGRRRRREEGGGERGGGEGGGGEKEGGGGEGGGGGERGRRGRRWRGGRWRERRYIERRKLDKGWIRNGKDRQQQ